MGLPKEHREATCKMDAATDSRLRDRLPSIAEKIIENCTDTGCFTHVDFEPIPSKQSVIEIIEKLREVIFPGYFNREKLDPVNLKYYMGQTVSVLFDLISEQVTLSIRHDCFRYDKPCSECRDRGHDVALALLEEIPGIREILATTSRRPTMATRLRGAPTKSSSATRAFLRSPPTGSPTSCTNSACRCCRGS